MNINIFRPEKLNSKCNLIGLSKYGNEYNLAVCANLGQTTDN